MYSSLKRKTPLKAKSGIGGGKQKEVDPDYKQWKRERLAHHHHTPTKADRAEFTRNVVKALMERAGGSCEACKMRPDAETHHIVGRGRGGRGVFENGLRLCTQCHREIQDDEEKLQYWIREWELRYGPRFWFDAEDIEEYERKQSAIKEAEEEQRQRMEALEPVIELLTVAAGRKLNSKEVRLLDNLDDREMAVFAHLMADICKGATPDIEFGYGKFND